MVRYLPVFLLCFYSLYAIGQGSVITGKVTDDADGKGLPGVTVRIDGTTTGAITDIDGNYNIEVAKGQTLIFQMVGMESVTITIANQSTINISLKAETTLLDGVVVNGFQEVERKLFTGSSARLEMDEIEIMGEPDISRMLEGQVAGVSVDNVSGTFGSTPKIRIRGNTSINGNNQPLFVVDGVIDIERQYHDELEEETGISKELVEAIHPFLLVHDASLGL